MGLPKSNRIHETLTKEDEHRSSHMIPFPSMWQLGFGVQGSAIKNDIAAAGVTVISLVWITNNGLPMLTSFKTHPSVLGLVSAAAWSYNLKYFYSLFSTHFVTMHPHSVLCHRCVHIALDITCRAKNGSKIFTALQYCHKDKKGVPTWLFCSILAHLLVKKKNPKSRQSVHPCTLVL